MTARASTVRLVCTECKRTTKGSPGDEWRYGCELCGGQMKVIRWSPTKRKRR